VKEVVFKKLYGKNFLSIGNVPIEFDFSSGINIITGYNFDKNDENGSGKTTIVQLFYWTLFGTTIAKLKKSDILNDVNKKGCIGILEFDVTKNGVTKSYKIERGIKPSYCKLFIDGDEDENPPAIELLNKQIENIISSSSIIFKNCIVHSLNNSVPFMQQGKADRNNFVQSIFRLEILKHMEKMARQKYNEFSREQDVNLQTLKLLEQNRDNYKQKEKEFEDLKKEKIRKLKIRKTDYENEIGVIKEKTVDIDGLDPSTYESVLNELSEDIHNTKEKMGEIKADISSSDAVLKTFASHVKSYDIDEELVEKEIGKEEAIKKAIDSIPLKIDKLHEENVKLDAETKSAKSTLKKIEKYGDICLECERPFSKEEQKNNQDTIDQLKETIKNSDETRNSNREKIDTLTQKKRKLMALSEAIKQYKELLEIKEKIKGVEAEKEKLEEKIAPLEEILNSKGEEFREISTKLKEMQDLISTNKNLNSQVENLVKMLSTVEEDILEAENEKNTFEVLISENDEKLGVSKDKVDSTKENLDVFDNIKFIVSEEGIKSYIINKLITVLNERIEYYLEMLESNAKLTFDEFFDYELLNDKGLEKSYENFSGGERKRIDLACLFSFLDIRRIQGDVRFNVIFFDELLDSAISSNACDLIFNILNERKDLYNENSYIITHRKEFKSENKKLINNTIFLEKRNGFTKIGEQDDIEI